MQMEDTQDCIRHAGEVLVQKGRYPELLMHEGLTRKIGSRCCICTLSALAEASANDWEIRIRAAG